MQRFVNLYTIAVSSFQTMHNLVHYPPAFVLFIPLEQQHKGTMNNLFHCKMYCEFWILGWVTDELFGNGWLWK